MSKENCTGWVKWWSASLGYGFIIGVPQYPGMDIFVYYDDIAGDGYRNLEEGDAVHFVAVENVVNGRYKGMKAINVRRHHD